MLVTWNRWTLVIALAALMMGTGLAAPLFRMVVRAQTSQQAADGARLMRGAVDLHYHVDPGYGCMNISPKRKPPVCGRCC